MVLPVQACTNVDPRLPAFSSVHAYCLRAGFTITLCGGQGRSPKLKALDWRVEKVKLGRFQLPMIGPAIVESSPGEKLSIVVGTVVCPQPSIACMS